MQLHQQSTAARPRAAEAGYVFEATLLPLEMDFTQLIQRCITESERFYRGLPNDSAYAYELFRRALVDESEAAWEYIYQHYAPLVESWVRRSSAFNQTGESSEFFVVSAFTKFWRAMRAKTFNNFPNLAALLHYLQLCTSCVVIDSVRTQSWAEMLPEEALAAAQNTDAAPDDAVVERASRAELWTCIDSLVKDPAERVILYESFVLCMKPGDIFAQHTDLFPAVSTVYNLKRNLLERLSRSQQLRRLVAFDK